MAQPIRTREITSLGCMHYYRGKYDKLAQSVVTTLISAGDEVT